jgi:hypothetical protein
VSQTNPKDPLLKAGPTYQRELFNRFAQNANGFSTEDVIGAASNIIINALRQAHSTRIAAESRYDEIFGKMKSLLLNHYDVLGRKRGVFPFDQVIEMDRFNDKEGFKRN